MNEYKMFLRNVRQDPMITKISKKKWGIIGYMNEHIRYLFVKPKYRNRGICTKLMDKHFFQGCTPETIKLLIKNGKCKKIDNEVYYYGNGAYITNRGFSFMDTGLLCFVSYNKYDGNGKFKTIGFYVDKNSTLDEIELELNKRINAGKYEVDYSSMESSLKKSIDNLFKNLINKGDF